MQNTKEVVNYGTAGYCGTVDVMVKDASNTILYKNSFHNKGHKTLFKFLCECLAGDYTDADKFKPLKIRIFNFNGTPQTARTRFTSTAEIPADFETDVTPLSGAIMTDTRAQVQEVDDLQGHKVFTTTFHFTIPFAYLTRLDKDINLMMLYPSNVGRQADNQNLSNNETGLLAYYLCTTGQNSAEKWAPIKLAEFENKENTNLIIEWKMSILNID